MVFSSIEFLFFFLPSVLLLYYLLYKSRKLQNLSLFVGSLLFYAWGEPKIVFVMLGSIAVNWFLGLLVQKYKKRPKGLKALYALTGLFNFGLLYFFKYMNFSFETVGRIFGRVPTLPKISLPIGISFFTFQAFSYVTDIGRGRAEAQKSPFRVGLYISFFPQLIAGPIVRYESIAEQLEKRRENFDDFSSGVERFIKGFLKKVLLANSLALTADAAFGAASPSQAFAWLGLLAYGLQIYHDFSAYSDMAIGLGLMFGFKFPENFNYPYAAASLSDFWRRWHISLGTWFRDYVYFPLGGSRVKSKGRLLFNLFLVWLLTGLWHGADLSFVAWGLFYFALISLEKLTDFERRFNNLVWLKRSYSLLMVFLAWVLFRAENMGAALEYYRALLGFSIGMFDADFYYYLRNFAPLLVLSALFALPKPGSLLKRVKGSVLPLRLAYAVAACLLFIVGLSYLVKGSYNPFIYFNF